MDIRVHNQLPQRFYRNIAEKARTIKEEQFGANFELEKVEYGLGILELLLGLRFLFELFNASTLNLLAKLVYVVTFPFTAPFWGLFGKNPSYALSRGELETLAAMLIYPLITWAALAIIKTRQRRTA